MPAVKGAAQVNDLVVALVARRFYLEDHSKLQIADELGISRFKVARILEQAVRDGVVRITVTVPPEIDLDLSEQVAERHGLRQVVVVRPPADDDQDEQRRLLAQACASVLAHRLHTDDVFGVSWGRALSALADTLPQLPQIPVVQMVGSIPSADLNVNSLELVRRIGQQTGGDVYPLHVPWVLDSRAVANALRATPHVQSTLTHCNAITFALVGVGAWAPGGSTLRSLLPADLVESLDRRGAVAEMCGTVVDAQGRTVGGRTLEPRCITITTDQLLGIGDIMGLAAGPDKAPAIAATIRAGLLQRLVTDSATAQTLLTL